MLFGSSCFFSSLLQENIDENKGHETGYGAGYGAGWEISLDRVQRSLICFSILDFSISYS